MIRFLKIGIVCSAVGILLIMYGMFFANTSPEVLETNEIAQNRLSLMSERLKGATVPDFTFTNQYGDKIDQSSVAGKIVVVDFFFTSCVTICPIMGANKALIQEYFETKDDIVILSHSIDSLNDSVPVLRKYAERFNAVPGKWHLVTGSYSEIDIMAQNYYVTAKREYIETNEFIHDGSFILVDRARKIRGIYDGTNTRGVTELISDIDILLNE